MLESCQLGDLEETEMKTVEGLVRKDVLKEEVWDSDVGG